MSRTKSFPARRLDDKGRCCERTPKKLLRPIKLFCPRCCCEFDVDGAQRPNWAWAETKAGRFVPTQPRAEYAMHGRPLPTHGIVSRLRLTIRGVPTSKMRVPFQRGGSLPGPRADV